MTGTIFLAASETSVAEGDGFASVQIRRTGDLSGAVAIEYAVTGDTATPELDYGPRSGTVRMTAGQDSVVVRIPILDDALAESTELLVLSILDLDSGTLSAPRTARISILDDEAPVPPPVEPPRSTPYRVSFQDAVAGLNQPMRIEFVPGEGSTALVAEKGGRIVVADVATGQVRSVLLDLTGRTNSFGDRGLMDIAIHPDFADNPYLYGFVVVDPAGTQSLTGLAGPDGGGNRYAHVLRWTLRETADGFSVVPGSETVLVGTSGRSLADISGRGAVDSTAPANRDLVASDILDNRNPSNPVYKDDYIKVDSLTHAGGGLAFGPDGRLYVSIGDGVSFNYTDQRAVSVQDVDSLAGKILRIDPITGLGLPDNPFVQPGDDLSDVSSRVFQMGMRNPFSITFLPDGRLLSTDTGWYSWEELNAGGPGANFGWPFFEGADNGVRSRAPGYAFIPQAGGFYADVASGAVRITDPFRAFSHDSAQPGFQFQAITGGDVVYDGNRYPAAFRNDYFFADVSQGQIYAVDTIDRRSVQWVGRAPSGFGPVHFEQGPDGFVYLADIGGGRIQRLVIAERNPSVSLQYSLSADRLDPLALSGAVLARDAYVFTSSPGTIRSVSFWLDDTTRSGAADRVELAGPFDLSGTLANGRAGVFDVDALREGSHTVTALVTFTDGTTTVVNSSFTVDRPDPAPLNLLQFSTAANRSGAQGLNGAVLTGDVHIFATPSGAVQRISFWLDDPNRTGAPRQVETLGPWDFAGTAANGTSRIFDIDALTEGTHRITALVQFADGRSSVVTSTFTVDLPDPGASQVLQFSTASSRANALALSGATLTQDVYVFAQTPAGARSVSFWLDDPNRTGAADRVELVAPFDFSGTATNGTARLFDVDALSEGTHRITALVTLQDGTTRVSTSTFTIDRPDVQAAFAPATITARADDSHQLYVNGRLVLQDANWRDAERAVLALEPGDVIAVRATDNGGPGGLFVDVALSDGTRLGSSAAWKVSTSATGDWTARGFDDSAWGQARAYGGVAAPAWSVTTGLTLPADSPGQWIWTRNNIADDLAYFRYTIPDAG